MITQFRNGALARLTNSLLADLPDRYREVLERRYGLGREAETLEAIGEDFGVTRERVRQIEAAGFAALKKTGGEAQAGEALTALEDYLDHHGLIRREQKMFEEIATRGEGGQLWFLLDLGSLFSRHHERDWHWSLWSSGLEVLPRAQAFLESLCETLTEYGKAMGDDDFITFTKEFCKKENFDFSEPAIWSYVDVSKTIDRGPFGEWGLVDWPEIVQRGVRDRAYLVLKSKGAPMHFREVAQAIVDLRKKLDLSWPVPDEQTVHNELLKDSRFVLMGRGLYALHDWGYEPGTIREVITAVLGGSSHPLTPSEVLEQVLEKRMVKPTTVLLNLHNKQYFARTADGRYIVRS